MRRAIEISEGNLRIHRPRLVPPHSRAASGNWSRSLELKEMARAVVLSRSGRSPLPENASARR